MKRETTNQKNTKSITLKGIVILLISFLIVACVNYTFIFAYAYKNEEVYESALSQGNIEQILLQDNKIVKLSDYNLSNWGDVDVYIDSTPIITELKKSQYKLVGKGEQVLVRFLQNRWNSIAQIDLNSTNFPKYKSETYSKSVDTCVNFEIVKIFGEYYLINDYTYNQFGFEVTAVYKATSPEDIGSISEIAGEIDYYGFSLFSFYPEGLFLFASTTLDKVLNIGFVLLETFIVYKIIKRFRKGTN